MKKNILLLKISPPIETETPHPYAFRFPFMLKYTEALLARNNKWNIRLMDCQIAPLSLEALVDSTLEFSADIIVIFSITTAYLRVIDYARKVKERKPGVFIISIGQDFTFCPDRYVYPGSPIDLGIMGEAEEKVCFVIERLSGGHSPEVIRGESYLSKMQTVTDLDALPFPAYDRFCQRYSYVYPLSVKKRLRWGHILSSRGCPYRCIFCSQTIRESYGQVLRKRSPGNIVDEIEYLVSNGANIIGFADDNFTTDENHVTGFCGEIMRRKINVPWIAHARIDNVDSRLLAVMRAAGCVFLRFGVESASARVLNILQKTEIDNWAEKAVEVFGYCKNFRIDTAALFLIGNPTETREEIAQSMLLAKKLKPSVIQVSFFTPYPGSQAFQSFKPGMAGVDLSKMYHYNKPAINLSNVGTAELQKTYKKFYAQFLLNPVFLLRHFLKYALFYLLNPDVFLRLVRIKNYLAGNRKKYDRACG